MAATQVRPALFPQAHAIIVGTLVLAGVIAGARHEPGFVAWLALVAYLGAATAVVLADLRTLKAPNRIVYPSLILLLGISAWAGLSNLQTALAGGSLTFALLLIATLVSRGAMGMGDAKFGALGGLVTGLGGVMVMLASAFILAAIVALVALTLGGYNRRDVIPFTPFLVAGTILAVGAGSTHLVP